jgi:leucyl-tRNA synthetase/8-oxo-dGTP pyrophosphatase MutT (NUDIX family)
MEPYNPKNIEGKWQKAWADAKLYETAIATSKEKLYVLDMFPYPSGEGLHVGHPKGYIATDIYSRMKKMQGFEVLHPMGWDAFGLPAEQFALNNKVHPRVAVEKNIARFKEQLSIIGFNYDWSKEINTTDPEFYKWTQWIFKQMWKKGLAYESHEPINWCPSCKTGLANEDLESDGTCERCGTKVEKKPLRQWVLKITDYADRMIEDLGKLDWPEGVKLAQKNWIGRSSGSKIKFDLCVTGVEDGTYSVDVFTTRADTLMGTTFIAISAELAHTWMDMGWKPKSEITSFIEKTLEEEKNRTVDFKTELLKDGIATEVDAIHPVTKEKIPVYIANYVLPGYGTGALMGVPAHDERDADFASRYNLPIKEVIRPDVALESTDRSIFTGEGTLVQSGIYDGLTSEEARKKITEDVGGEFISQYKLKDWVFARQRYWGEPFPMVFDENHVAYPVADSELPVKLPEVEKYEPTGTGESPLAAIDNWVNVTGFIDRNNEWNTIPSFESYAFDKGEPFDINDGPGGDAYQSGAPIVERNNIACIIKHPTEEKYLVARWKQVDWNGFATGGIEKGQTPEDTARQEVREETGFTNIKSVEAKDFSSHGLFYHVVKKENRFAHYRLVVVELGGLEQEAISDDEKAICDFEWVEKDKVAGLLTRFDMKSLWEYYTTGKVESENPIKLKKGKRETNTMPQWAGSSWYYLRFPDPKNATALSDPGIEKKWQPVDVYVGGDHATRHLIYARFWHKFLFDIGVVSYDEPFMRLEFLGFILAEDGRKMSKRLGNVINPDDVVREYGADALRVYEMFMAPFEQTVAWDTKGIIGAERFLERVWKLRAKVSKDINDSDEMKTVLHKTIKKVSADIDAFKFNTAISAMMICLNRADTEDHVSLYWYQELLKILAPFAPHIAEELWNATGGEGSVHATQWPAYDEALLVEAMATIAIQIGGKLRGTVSLPRDMAEINVLDEVKKTANYQKYVGEATPKKVIFVPNKLINIVI